MTAFTVPSVTTACLTAQRRAARDDARDIVARADGVIFLARWRHTPQKAIESALQMIVRVDSRLIGLALTQVDMRQLSRYGDGDAGYNYRRYRAYYAG